MLVSSRRVVVACVLLALSLGAAGGCARSRVAVARVEGNAIYKAELDHWVSVDGLVTGSQGGTARREMLGLLISARWVAGEAARLHVGVSAAQVAKKLALLSYDRLENLPFDPLPREPLLRRLLESAKVRTADRLWLMRLNLLAAELERRRVLRAEGEVTGDQIVGAYRAHIRQFRVPQQSEIEIVMTRNAASTLKAKHEIQAGARFLAVARRVSSDPEAPHGLQLLVRGTDEPEFENLVFAARPGPLIGPVNTATFFYDIFKVLKATPAHIRPLAQAEPTVRRQLATERARTDLSAAFERDWSAKTTCAPGYVTVQCGG